MSTPNYENDWLFFISLNHGDDFGISKIPQL